MQGISTSEDLPFHPGATLASKIIHYPFSVSLVCLSSVYHIHQCELCVHACCLRYVHIYTGKRCQHKHTFVNVHNAYLCDSRFRNSRYKAHRNECLSGAVQGTSYYHGSHRYLFRNRMVLRDNGVKLCECRERRRCQRVPRKSYMVGR